MASPLTNQFFAAPFAVDGELMGIGTYDMTALSPKWLGICEEMIQARGPNFRTSFGPTLSHLEVKLVSESGVGLGTFFANGTVVVSTAYLRGQSPEVEKDVLNMFIESLRKVRTVQQAKATEQPFGAMATISERPLHVIVTWADPGVSEQDEEMIGEIANHFAGAYLCRYK